MKLVLCTVNIADLTWAGSLRVVAVIFVVGPVGSAGLLCGQSGGQGHPTLLFLLPQGDVKSS
jgi:hypothetical protein